MQESWMDKLAPMLQELVLERRFEVVPLIVQTVDGLRDEDRQVIAMLGGRVKDDLHIIDAFSAELPIDALSSLVLSPRVRRIYYDSPL